MAFGLAVPTVLAKVDITLQRRTSWEDIDACIATLLGEPVPAEGEPQDATARMLWRLMHVHAVVQRQQKIPVFGNGRILGMSPAAGPGHVQAQLALPCHEAGATQRALRWSLALCDAFAPGAPANAAADVRAALEKCREDLRQYALAGINTFHFLRTAHDLGIPAMRVLLDFYSFGLGIHSHVMKSTFTDGTSSIGVTLAHSKAATVQLLRRHGVPVPMHRKAGTAEEALEIAESLGYPVVVKPDDQEQGRGVFAGLQSAAAVREAYEAARGVSQSVLVEKHHHGSDYRLTVYQDEVVKVLHRRPGGVVGDGVHDLAGLVRIEQQQPRMQRVLRERGSYSLDLDDEARSLAAEQGVAPDSVPGKGRFIALRRKANVSAGGIQQQVQVADCHPDNIALAVRATKALRLDLCGVDLIIPDIARSWLDTGAVIVELNAQPQIGWYHGPEAYGIVLKKMLGGRWDIPLHLAVCDPAAVPEGRQQAAALFAGCGCNAYSTPLGAWIDGQCVTPAPVSGLQAAQVLLLDTGVRSAGMVLTLDEVRRHGLPAGRFERILFMKPAQLAPADRQRWAEVEAMVRDNAREHAVAEAA